MKIIRYLLFPVSILYKIITQVRNYLFDIGYTKSLEFEIKLISVGNLSVGGTGKTPAIEYLIRLLRDKKKVATLSRGYGRRTSGFFIADDELTSDKIGDEPRQFYLKFKDDIIVSVGEERAMAIPEILYHEPETDVILLDDAFQHRYVVPGINILLSDYRNPFYNDHILPSGNLRESRSGAKRADILIITKCPRQLSEKEMEDIESNCRKYIKNSTSVFFSSIAYLDPVPVFKNESRQISDNIILISGIGKSSYIKEYVSQKYNLLHSIKFADHHKYSINDLKKIKKEADGFKENISILTTEKDMVKIKELEIDNNIFNLPLFYLPIEMQFLRQQQVFDELILNYVSDTEFN